MSEPRPPISTERARLMLAKVQVKLQRPHLPDEDRQKLLEAERLLHAKLRFYDEHPEKGQHVQDWRLAMYHLRRSLGLPQEHPAAATLALAQAHAEAVDVDGEGDGGGTDPKQCDGAV